MRRLAPGVCALLCALSTAVAAEAGQVEACRGTILTDVAGLAAAEAKRAGDLVNADGLFWRINKPGVAAVILRQLIGIVITHREETDELWPA